MRILAILVEPANYTLDRVKNIYDPRGIEYVFIKGRSQASGVETRSIDGVVAVWNLVRSHDAFIINGYTGTICVLAILMNILLRKKPMALDSDTELQIPKNPIKRLAKWMWLHFLFTRKYCYGFAGGNYGHKELFRHYGMSEERIYLAPMMVDNAKYVRKLPDSPHKHFRFGYLGRLIPLKQVDKIIQALPAGCELHIVGDGEERVRLEALAKDKQVIFHGKVFGEEKIELLHSLDCLVLYSWYESWGLVVNEALACGIPVIVSDKVGARADLVSCEKPTGLVAQWDDINDLADKMRKMAMDRNLWAAISENARRRMRDWDYSLYAKNFDAWRDAINK